MSSGLDTHLHLHRPGAGDDPVTIVLLHGTGADEHDLVPLGRHLRPSATLLSPRGNVRENDMPRWFARHAEGVLDTADVERRADALAGWLDAATDAYDLDATRLVAVGFSNGANVAAALMLRRPDVFRAAALFAPMVPLEPVDRVDLSRTSIFISAGRRDPICPPEQAERVVALLADRDAAVDLRWHDGGHQLPRDHADAARDWLGAWADLTASDTGGVP